MSDALDQVYRDEWGRLLALLIAQTRRLDLAEDALAEAFAAATRRWPLDGVPTNPAAWLLTAARRRVIDALRAEAMAARKAPLLAVDDELRRVDNSETGDDLLRLVLLAAHPSLTEEAGAALTLRLVLGVSTADIARLFLVSEPTMAARLTRARKKVVTAGVPLAIPDPAVLPDRLDVVARVAYLAFTAGYAPGSGPDVVRVELAGEAIRLVRLVRGTSAAAANASLQALLALMLLQHSRRDARVGASGEPVLLEEQDRADWHADEITEGRTLLAELTGSSAEVALGSPLAASYLLQALIAAEHTHPGGADWSVVAGLYAQLDRLTGSPVVRMNRAVALAESGDLAGGLALLDDLADALPYSHRLPAVHAELARRAGDVARARVLLDRAIDRCDNDAERSLLERRRADLD